MRSPRTHQIEDDTIRRDEFAVEIGHGLNGIQVDVDDLARLVVELPVRRRILSIEKFPWPLAPVAGSQLIFRHSHSSIIARKLEADNAISAVSQTDCSPSPQSSI